MGPEDVRARPEFERWEKRLALSRSRTMFICRQVSNLVAIPIALARLYSLSSFLISETDPPWLQGNQHSYNFLPTDGQQDEEREPAE
jgi:hypothetical protein